VAKNIYIKYNGRSLRPAILVRTLGTNRALLLSPVSVEWPRFPFLVIAERSGVKDIWYPTTEAMYLTASTFNGVCLTEELRKWLSPI
jgi:hypothetical protein